MMNEDAVKQQNSPAGKKNLSYRDAGVDIDAGEQLVQRIKPLVKETHRPGVLGSLGGFGGLFELPWQEYRAPVMVTGTDGVGTKLNLAIRNNRYDTIGIDLVAMCVNDIIVTGAEPLVFLDYFATSKLDTTIATTVIAGIAEGCKLAGCALSGGETAEMPGMYRDKDFDLAGFSVGLVEKSEIIDGSQIQAGDRIIGLASSGPHSNGYSLINKLLQDSDVAAAANGTDILDALMQPTRIYVKSVLSVLGKSASSDHTQPLKALAHITGGGLLENIPRVLPAGMAAQLNSDSWQIPEIFQWIQQQGNITSNEMYRVFNCGIGMIAIVQPGQVATTLKAFQDAGESAMEIGTIEKMDNSAADPVVVVNGTGSLST